MTEHLSARNAAAFVDGTLTREERVLVERHLADCAACREEAAEVAKLVRPHRRIPRLTIPLAAAAAIALVAVGINSATNDGPPVLRGGTASAAIQTTQPAPNQTVTPSTGFGWRSVPAASEYRLTVTNAAGDVVAEKLTSDTTTTLELARRTSFRWYVTAILKDGTVVSSAVVAFRTQ